MSLYFEPVNWDTIEFKEPKEWVFNWACGGWNSTIAHSKKEAIKKAKKEWKDSKMKIDEKSFRVPTYAEYKSLMNQSN